MDATRRFGELVQHEEVALDEAALLIAAHDHVVDVDLELERLDALAAAAPETSDELARYLFVDCGFTGNAQQYYDPRNSYLDEVLGRRIGIPITLSVLMLEIGRRRGLALSGVGMPGHFLVQAEPGILYDPFSGGVRVSEAECRARFAAVHGDAPFLPSYLESVGSRAILARMLANLVGIFAVADPAAAVWALRLRLRIPEVAPHERREAAALLGRLGHFAEAASTLEAMLDGWEGPDAQLIAAEAAAFRARSN